MATVKWTGGRTDGPSRDEFVVKKGERRKERETCPVSQSVSQSGRVSLRPHAYDDVAVVGEEATLCHAAEKVCPK